MTLGLSGHSVAIVQAVFVTFLWSTSWVLIKIGLDDLALPPLTFAGRRYLLAALIVLPLAAPGLRAAARAGHEGRRHVLAS